MNRFLLGAAGIALLASASGHVLAQGAATQDVTITASVPVYCSIGGLAAGSALTAVDVPVSALGVVDTTVQNRSQANVTCNQKAHIDLTSLSGGVTGPPAPGGFTNKIHYTATAGVGVGTGGSINTATTSATQGDTGAAFAAQTLAIAITPLPPSLPLVNGAYSDTLKVTLTPY